MLLNNTKVWIFDSPTDMRKSIDGLSMLVANVMNENPTNGDAFVFWNRNKDKIKLIYWHINGFCLLYKRLEKESFKIPTMLSSTIEVSTKELRWLLEGLDIITTTGYKSLNYDIFC